MTATPVVIVGHGSRDPRSSATMRRLADRVDRRWPGPVRAAFLDFDAPSVPEALADLPEAIVVPALLTRAYHRRIDLPELLATVDSVTRVTSVLGPESADEPADPLLLQALTSQLPAAFDGLVLIAAGTSDASARSTVESVARSLGSTLNVPCAVGYASASGPTAAEAVSCVRALGARRVAAASYFLAPGRLYDAAVDSARSGGVLGVAKPLGAATELVDLILARISAPAPLGVALSR